ncbi:SLC13 family permease [Burkholderia ubonensis]|uniref:Citrate transporter n=1 Tax=Burkholderia ubonensis TaxID=101571 RepID=A0A1R1JIK0_9BURK|nr:SLC13 family permease [Burkholderia ubonensis]OMG75215.1 citrate transporter [Burkholderia ubonensis]
MSAFQIIVVLAAFSAVILVIAFDLVDMTVAALVGTCLLVALGILTTPDIADAFRGSSGPLSLLFGGMVVARILGTTGVFDLIGDYYLRATRGSGRRFLLLLILIVAPLCAVLPNATTVVLLAPVIIRVAQALEIDIAPPMILTAIISNCAGLLTLVGDPATYLIGSAVGMTFDFYLRHVSLGGVMAIAIVVPLLPRLMPGVWNLRRTLPPARTSARIERPVYACLTVAVLVAMVGLFVFGENLPAPIVPPAAALIASALALLVGYAARVEPTDNVLRDVDWKTLVFLASIFCLVQAIVKTGMLQHMALRIYDLFGSQFTLVALTVIAAIGILSSLLANVPVAAASIVMIKSYLVAAEVVPETALSSHFTHWPNVAIPVFVAMMFGATLGGNATLIGASANIVSAGICERHGAPITFLRFLRVGLPVTLCQLAASALYVIVLSRLMR